MSSEAAVSLWLLFSTEVELQNSIKRDEDSIKTKET